MKTIISIVIILFLSWAVSTAQTYPSSVYVTGNGKRRPPQEVTAMKRLVDIQRGSQLLSNLRTITYPNYGGRTGDSRSSKELMNKARKYVAPAIEIQNNYADFLKQPNTGVVKLVSQESCSTSAGSDGNEKFSEYLKRCAPDFIQGRGKYFSFRQKEYVEDDLADIGLEKDLFFSSGMMNQGILTELGGVDFQNVTLTGKGIEYLVKFAPSMNMEGAAKEFEQFNQGLKINDLTYSKVVRIEKDKTYALRAIAYNSYFLVEDKNTKALQTKLFPLKEDKREDVIVVFRVVEKNVNSVTLLWKELQRKPAPEMLVSILEAN